MGVYIGGMLRRLFFPALGLMALALIALAMVWPQGLGDRSPGPFGETPYQQRPEIKAAMLRQQEKAMQEAERAKRTVTELQTQAVSPSQ
ncbi:MAG TPA: hypothetical protein VIO94_17010 [Phenylobacterium sp.]